jgi:hypothetical protein
MTVATMQTLLGGVADEHGSVLTEFTEKVFLRYRQRVVFQDHELLVRPPHTSLRAGRSVGWRAVSTRPQPGTQPVGCQPA